MEHALVFRSFSTALHFLHTWPEHRYAARLVLARQAEINGNLYFLLDPAARWLEVVHPLAATLLRRAMIEDTLGGAKSKRYRHAVRHLGRVSVPGISHQRLRPVRDARGLRRSPAGRTWP